MDEYDLLPESEFSEVVYGDLFKFVPILFYENKVKVASVNQSIQTCTCRDTGVRVARHSGRGFRW